MNSRRDFLKLMLAVGAGITVVPLTSQAGLSPGIRDEGDDPFWDENTGLFWDRARLLDRIEVLGLFNALLNLNRAKGFGLRRGVDAPPQERSVVVRRVAAYLDNNVVYRIEHPDGTRYKEHRAYGDSARAAQAQLIAELIVRAQCFYASRHPGPLTLRQECRGVVEVERDELVRMYCTASGPDDVSPGVEDYFRLYGATARIRVVNRFELSPERKIVRWTDRVLSFEKLTGWEVDESAHWQDDYIPAGFR